jgi:acyl-coenzyme A thioesterase PaaI-like protein
VTLVDLLGAASVGPGAHRFAIGRELHGAFGGAFGGVIASCTLIAAREVAPGRVPVGLDVRFLRGLPAGSVTAEASVVHAGRSMTVVAVDLHGPDGRHGVRATVSLADTAALHPLDVDVDVRATEPVAGRYDDAPDWPEMPGRDIPILKTLAPRIVGRAGDGIATGLRMPWTPDRSTAAEACCFVADMCVGPPVAAACVEGWVPHPNTDLSLRFAGDVDVATEVIGIGTTERVAGGVAAVRVEVRSNDAIVAIGVATSVLLRGERAGT